MQQFPAQKKNTKRRQVKVRVRRKFKRNLNVTSKILVKLKIDKKTNIDHQIMEIQINIKSMLAKMYLAMQEHRVFRPHNVPIINVMQKLIF